MLPSSTRGGQCLSGSFRASFAALPKRYPDSQRERFSTSSHRKERRPQRSTSPLRKGHSDGKNPRLLGSPYRSIPRFQLNRRDAERHLRDSLNTLKKKLETTKASLDSDVTQLAALDPLGTYWPEFKKRLESVLEEPGLAGSLGLDGLMTDIGYAEQGDWATEMPRVLHFGFIDYVLLNRARDEPEKGAPLAELKFPTEWYTSARQVQRDVHLHIGPTNSGKTYNALKRLEESGNGFYAGPLRLLAHEVYTRFKAKGVSCDLVTGDDVRLEEDPNTKLSASTVEMVDVGKHCEVAVIDEIQMMADRDRGWAWTRAFLGANANEVHICGENRVLPLIRELTASTGDVLHVHEYQRLNGLKVMNKSMRGNLKDLRKGDCLVAFSVVSIHALKQQIELDTGRRCAIVYGSLPPETRAQQAALFNDPNNDYDFLVASDAIGMGLNLSVKRIIFHSVVKFDGASLVTLSVPQIKQIGGRAGRYRNAHQAMNNSAGKSEGNIGLVTTLTDEDLHIVKAAMQTEAAPIRKAGMLPPGEALEEFESRLPRGIPFEYIFRRVCGQAALHERFRVCNIRDQTQISRTFENVRDLTLEQRLILTAAPASISLPAIQDVMRAFALCVANRKPVSVVDVPEVQLEVLEQPVSDSKDYLQSLETLHKSLVLYLWLSYRFLGIFKDREMAMYAKEMTEERINTCLLEFSANPDLRKRMISYKRKVLPVLREGTEEEPELGMSGRDTILPVDWTRGSDVVEFDDEPEPGQRVANSHA